IIESRKQNESGISVAELETRVIKLSYVDADAAMVVLKSMGFNALLPAPAAAPAGAPPAAPAAPAPADPAAGGGGGGGDQPADQAPAEAKPDAPAIPAELSNNDLPLIIRMPGPQPSQAGLVGGGGSVQRDALGLSMVLGATSRLTPDTIASPSSQIMVMYN